MASQGRNNGEAGEKGLSNVLPSAASLTQVSPIILLCSFASLHDYLAYLTIQAPVPGKPISANRGLSLTNRGRKFIRRLDSVPESTINTNDKRDKRALNLIHLARSINSLIGGKT